MADQEQEAQDPQQDGDQSGNSREGYINVETGSTKHPDAENTEDGKVVATIGVEVGESLRDAVELYGEEFVYDQYIRSVTVAAQGKVRRELDKGVPVNTVEQELDDLDPTEKRTTVKDPQAQAVAAWNNMDEDEKAKFRAIMEEQEG